MSKFFRTNKIDPYKLEHAMINDYKRWLLLEINDPVGEKKGRGGPKAIQLGMTRLAHQRRFELAKLQRECPIDEGEKQ